ncbi:hypothetical protein Tco_1410995 [Tanacetum coccineum]
MDEKDKISHNEGEKHSHNNVDVTSAPRENMNVEVIANQNSLKNKERGNESMASGHFKQSECPKTGGSILSLLEEVVKVGQVMGYRMEGCMANMEEIIEIIRKLQNCDEIDSMELAQKAKIKWAIKGDRTPKFFTAQISQQKRNILNIRGIMVDGIWVDNPKSVKREFLDHFSKRFYKADDMRATLTMEFPNRLHPDQSRDLEMSLLENCKSVTVGDKLAHQTLSHSYRRLPRGGIENTQFAEFSVLLHSCLLLKGRPFVTWTATLRVQFLLLLRGSEVPDMDIDSMLRGRAGLFTIRMASKTKLSEGV